MKFEAPIGERQQFGPLSIHYSPWKRYLVQPGQVDTQGSGVGSSGCQGDGKTAALEIFPLWPFLKKKKLPIFGRANRVNHSPDNHLSHLGLFCATQSAEDRCDYSRSGRGVDVGTNKPTCSNGFLAPRFANSLMCQIQQPKFLPYHCC